MFSAAMGFFLQMSMQVGESMTKTGNKMGFSGNQNLLRGLTQNVIEEDDICTCSVRKIPEGSRTIPIADINNLSIEPFISLSSNFETYSDASDPLNCLNPREILPAPGTQLPLHNPDWELISMGFGNLKMLGADKLSAEFLVNVKSLKKQSGGSNLTWRLPIKLRGTVSSGDLIIHSCGGSGGSGSGSTLFLSNTELVDTSHPPVVFQAQDVQHILGRGNVAIGGGDGKALHFSIKAHETNNSFKVHIIAHQSDVETDSELFPGESLCAQEGDSDDEFCIYYDVGVAPDFIDTLRLVHGSDVAYMYELFE
jgi:hypothetical protein